MTLPYDYFFFFLLLYREQNNTGQVRYCLSKAITADPKDVGLRFDLASLYFELGEYQRAAGLYSQIVELYPGNIVARKMAARVMLFHILDLSCTRY